MEICLQGRCGLSRFVESQKSLYSCIDWGMSTHIRDAYTFATVVLLLVNTTFCLESISECFVSSFFSFRTFGFVCFFTQTAVQEQTYFLCLFFLVLAFSFMFCLTGWLSDLSESGAGLSGSAWIFLGWWRSPGAGVLSGGRCDNCWQMTLWEREQESEKGLQVSSDIYSISQSSSSKYWLVGTTKNTEILSCPHTEKTTMTGQW